MREPETEHEYIQTQPKAAVAVICCKQPVESYLVLRRNLHPQDPWSGHFSFPGGRKEDHDFDIFATCLRETEEETGIQLSQDLLQRKLPRAMAGQLEKSSILVQPYLFSLENQPAIDLNKKEFQDYYWVEAEQLQTIELHTEAEVFPQLFFPAFPLGDYYIWGFTYKILQSLLRWDVL